MKRYAEQYNTALSTLMDSKQAFFAFSNDQVKEARQRLNIPQDTKLVNIQMGLICPLDNAHSLQQDMAKLAEEQTQQQLANNTVEEIIEYELRNYEAYYIGDIEDAYNVLNERYNFTREQVTAVYKATRHKYED